MRKLRNEELNRPSIVEYKKKSKLNIVVILDNVRSLNNIGSIFRTSDAFLMHSIHLCGITATPPHRDMHKTALGATDSVLWKYYKKTTDAITDLQNEGYQIIAIEQTEKKIPLNQFHIDKTKKYALIFGNEVKGVDQHVVDLCKASIEIPQQGTKHSLNISVCAGIVLWEFYKAML